MAFMGNGTRRRLERAGAVAFALLVWQACAMLLGETLLLVTPGAVLWRLPLLCREPGFLSAVGFSVLRIFSGYLLALFAGTLLAAVAARLRLAEVLLWPFMAAIKAVPVASFIILCLVWLDARNLSVFIAFLMVLPIVYTNLLQGIRGTDAKLLQMAALFRVAWPRRLVFIRLPHLRPYLFSACSVSIGLAWKAGIAAEVIGIPSGSIGEKLYEAKVYLNSVDLFAWTAVIVVISVLFEKLFLRLLRRLYGVLGEA